MISCEKSQAYLARRERRRARYGMIIISDRCRSTPHHYGGFAFRENEKQRLPTARLNAVLCCREQSIIMTTCASTTYCATRFPLIRAKIESTLTHPLLAASTVSLAKVATSRVLRTRRKAQRRAKSEWRSITVIEPYLRCCEKSPCDWKIRLHSANLPCELRLAVEKYEDHQRGVKTVS